MYCNLFSLTRSMSEGYTLSGSNKNPIMIKKKDVEITFDIVIKSGLEITMGVDIIPEMSHSILCHQDKSRTRATAQKLGWNF